MTFITGGIGHTDMKVLKIRFPMLGKNELDGLNIKAIYNPQIEMFARFKMKSSFHKTKRII